MPESLETGAATPTEAADIRQSPNRRPPLEPRKAIRFRRWLRGPRPHSGPMRLQRLASVVALIGVTLALGTWGFHRLPLTPKLDVSQSLYHAFKLYGVDIGPAGGGYKTSTGQAVHANVQIWVALALAALLVVRALLALARDRVGRSYMRHLLNGHVIVCGGGVHGTRLVRELADKHDVVLVELDPRALGLQAPRDGNEWRLVGDATAEETLLGAGCARAHWVVAITGDDYVNSQIGSVVRDLAQHGKARDGVRVLVQVEDPSLARFLEEGDQEEYEQTDPGERTERAPAPAVSVFGGNAMAAGALFGEGPKAEQPNDSQPAPLLAVEQEGPHARRHLLLAGDHPLLDAVILAALRRRRARQLREEELGGGLAAPLVRVTLIGPSAEERIDQIRKRWDPESQLLELEGRDLEPDEDSLEGDDRWWRDRRLPGHALVACSEALDGLGLTLAICRALGNGIPLTRVATQPESELDRHLEDRTKHSRYLATTEVRSIADLTWSDDGIRRIFTRERVASALRDCQLSDAEARADALLDGRRVDIYSDSAPRMLPPASRWLPEAVLTGAAKQSGIADPVPLSALIRAGLAVNLASARNLLIAAEELAARRGEDEHAFGAWCEYARRVPPEPPETLATPTANDLGAAVLRLRQVALALAAATGEDDPGALDEHNEELIKAHASLAALDLLKPDPTVVSLIRDSGRVAIFAGGADSMEEATRAAIGELLLKALLKFDGLVLTGGTDVGLPGAVRDAAAQRGVRLVGYAPRGLGDPGVTLRNTDGADEFSVREPLAMWADIFAAGVPMHTVRVVVFPGGPITTGEVLLARALGAKIVWIGLPATEGARLAERLPIDSDGVLEVPVDAMTLRSFLTWSPGPTLDPELQHQLAKYAHDAYREKQRGEKPPDDPAMADWERLLPTLQHSNLDQVNDLANKLAVVGKRLARNGEPLALTVEQIELLAEMEHGRYNYERLSAGWQLGQRHVADHVSPHLTPWAALEDKYRQWDRDAILSIDPALRAAKWGVTDLDAGDAPA
jgi:hypothetical protein